MFVKLAFDYSRPSICPRGVRSRGREFRKQQFSMPAISSNHETGMVSAIGRQVSNLVCAVGDVSVFAGQMTGWIFRGRTRRRVLIQSFYETGVRSVPVVIITGAFLGMVLAVQSFNQFRTMHLESRLGAVITMSLVTELGPVLAATMLAGRVGSAIAAELGTMRVTEQIDALRALGANPIQYLVVPRFLACLLLIPMLTAVADAVGILSGWLLSTRVLGVGDFDYWHYAQNYVTGYDVLSGLFKSIFFGAAIAIVSCHRGFHSGAGAEGVGKAATEAFVWSFIVILMLDFVLGVFITSLYFLIWPDAVGLM